MILFANGCSWTYGGGLNMDHPDQRAELDQLTWPKYLSDQMGAERFVNLAMSCGSNQRIYRTTLDWILAHTEETLRDTVAVIQLTEGARYEYYNPTSFDDPYENIDVNWVKVKADVQIPQDQHYKVSQDRIKYQHTTIQTMYTFIGLCESLAGLFNHYGIRYYFWSMEISPNTFFPAYRDYVFNKFNWLDWEEPTAFKQWKYDRISEYDAHPSLTGHKQLAQHFYEAIKND